MIKTIKILGTLVITCILLGTMHPTVAQHMVTTAYVSPQTLNQSIVIVQGERGHGTGWFVEPDLIVTNFHVVGRNGPNGRPLGEAYDQVIVQLYDGTVIPAQVIRVDRNADLAMLHVPHLGVPLRVADKPAQRGDVVHSIGNGGVDWFTMQVGEVDRQYRFNTPHWRAIHTFLRMTIKGGYSGSPVFNTLTGEVVGVLCGASPGTDIAIMVSHANLIKFVKGD